MPEKTYPNAEWRLGDFLSAVTAEVDRAQDVLSLKSLARGRSMSVQGLSLDLAVQVRVDEHGQPLFRSAEPGEPCATLLKLQLRETLENQSDDIRQRLETGGLGLPLAALPEIAPPQIAALQDLSVFTVDDLRRLCRTPALLAEASRITGIADPLLRRWLGLPYLLRIAPSAEWPERTALLEGGNLGAPAGGEAIFFGAAEATVLSWEESSIRVEIPARISTASVYAWIDGARTNLLSWTAGERPAKRPRKGAA